VKKRTNGPWAWAWKVRTGSAGGPDRRSPRRRLPASSSLLLPFSPASIAAKNSSKGTPKQTRPAASTTTIQGNAGAGDSTNLIPSSVLPLRRGFDATALHLILPSQWYTCMPVSLLFFPCRSKSLLFYLFILSISIPFCCCIALHCIALHCLAS
jgi:hypothetical protein